MGKFRSKLKRHTKGTKWARGQSATSNPENKKHRMAARSRFFQSNVNAGILMGLYLMCTYIVLQCIFIQFRHNKFRF